MNRRQVQNWMVAALSFLLLGCAALGRLTGADTGHWQANPMPQWEEAFRSADPRWRGADGAYSVPLSGSKTLWLFGDTWITDPEARGREGGRVIRNSVALQAIGKEGPGRIEFFWGGDTDEPKALFLPPTGAGWLWPLSGERIRAALYLFFGRFQANDSELGFEARGSLLFRVRNPDDAPPLWEMESFSVPFFEHSPQGDLIFGVACLAYEGFLYVYGVREDWTKGVEGRSLLVARVPVESLDNGGFSDWQFFSAEGWSPEVGHSKALFDGAATEMSVSYLWGKERFMAVYSCCGLSEAILGRLAPHPEGPWGKPVTLYRCPEVSWSEDYFCYAGKAHPELATGGDEQILTYAVNSWNLEDHKRDLRLYWPRFVRVVEK